MKEGQFSPGYAKSISHILDEYGVHISVLGCYINPSSTNKEELQSQLDFFEENLKYAKYMNAHMVGLETGYVGEKIDIAQNQTEEAYQYLLKNMRYLTDKAEKLGVMIGIEGVSCFIINDVKRMKRLMDDLNSPNVCVIFDPVNLLNIDNYKNQNEIITEAFDILGDKINVIHIKDFLVKDNELQECQIEKRLFDVGLLLSLIEKHKPSIEIILELVPDEDFLDVKKALDLL